MKEEVFKCSCNGEWLRVQKDDEDEMMWFVFLDYRGKKISLWWRLKMAFKYLFTNHTGIGEFMFYKEDAEEFIKHLNSLIPPSQEGEAE